VLHAAIRLLEQAKPQILYTQVVNYNAPLKPYNSRDLYLQHLGIRDMGCEIEGLVLNFRAWEWCWASGWCGGWAILR
jgi:hypothetical protein